jgi:hypothetical protein
MRMGRNETGYEGVNWIHVALHKVQRWVLGTVMNLLVCLFVRV